MGNAAPTRSKIIASSDNFWTPQNEGNSDNQHEAIASKKYVSLIKHTFKFDNNQIIGNIIIISNSFPLYILNNVQGYDILSQEADSVHTYAQDNVAPFYSKHIGTQICIYLTNTYLVLISTTVDSV